MSGDVSGLAAAAIEPRQMELSVNPDDGSLAKTPLSSVIVAATDALYSELHTMATGEIEVSAASSAVAAQSAAGGLGDPQGQGGAPDAEVEAAAAAAASAPAKREKMASLSFAQRRHELASRLARHSKALAQVSVLVSAYGYNTPLRAPAAKFPRRGEIAKIVDLSDRTLRHVRSAWVQADEAQDALYFDHDQLWKARKHPHDVPGALAVVIGFGGKGKRKGMWVDFPTDAALAVNRYESSEEKQHSEEEIMERLRGCVRRKLVMGEVGCIASHRAEKGQEEEELPWRVILEKSGGAVRLVHGTPRRVRTAAGQQKNNNLVYPMEARLTVLSESDAAEWTLLSINVAVAAKTGESNHQLNLSKKQMFDLHRLCARSMIVEEAQTKKLNEIEDGSKSDTDGAGKKKDQNGTDSMEVQSVASLVVGDKTFLRQRDGTVVSRPLSCLFDVAHTFAVSLHLEVMSAQALALQKGAWAQIAVSPVYFFDQPTDKTLGVLGVHFWTIDDRHGRPAMGDLVAVGTSDNSPSKALLDSSRSAEEHLFRSEGKASGRLTLEIRAVAGVGIVASVSSGNEIMASLADPKCGHGHLRQGVSTVVSATSSPFDLSVSDALLAAATLCAEQKCLAVASALRMAGLGGGDSYLPSWLKLHVECGAISVGAKILYCGGEGKDIGRDNFVALFRLECESKTGYFIPTFPSTMILLRLLACNDPAASDLQMLRQAATAINRRAPTSARKSVGEELTGRLVREAFDGLSRSMTLLGERVGVGGSWVDRDSMSASLRSQAIETACRDVRKSLATCAGTAATFGLAAIALGVTTGVNASVDVAGGIIKPMPEKASREDVFVPLQHILPIPPVSVVLNQQIIQKKDEVRVGEGRMITLLERDGFAAIASVSGEALVIHGFNVTVQTSSPSQLPTRTSCSPLPFTAVNDADLETPATSGIDEESQQTKRRKLNSSATGSPYTLLSVMDEVPYLAAMFAASLDE